MNVYILRRVVSQHTSNAFLWNSPFCSTLY